MVAVRGPKLILRVGDISQRISTSEIGEDQPLELEQAATTHSESGSRCYSGVRHLQAHRVAQAGYGDNPPFAIWFLPENYFVYIFFPCVA
jgi:hypothetical protein